MKRRISTTLIILLAASIMLILGACGKPETEEVSGILTNAVDKQISVRTTEGQVVFRTEDATVYELGEESELTVGDTIRVSYHKSFEKKHVDRLTVIKHYKPDLIFEGAVVGLKKGSVTVTGKSLTVEFLRDGDTAVRGNLKVGAEVSVTYDGDLSEFPYATDIKVVKEVKDQEEKKDDKKEEKKDGSKGSKEETVTVADITGIVAEFTEKTMLLAVDSANSYRFTLGKDFKVSGADKYVHTGDSVILTFTGELGKSPVAVEINIVRKAAPEKKTVNGKISSIEKDYLTINTGKRSYVIHTDKNTKYTGDKPAKGYKAEITYTGNLSRDALAANVYCVKVAPDKKVIFNVTFTDGTGNVISTQTVEKGKAAKAPKNPSREGHKFKGWDKDFSKVVSDLTVAAVWEKLPDPKPEPEPEPEKEIITEGLIVKWTADGDNSFTIKDANGTEIVLTAGDFTEIASGYFPAEGDTVKVTYLESDMKAAKIELVSKGGSGDEPAPEPEDETVDPEPAPEPEGETVDPEPAPEPEGEAVEPELASEPEPAPEPKEEPDVVISAEVTILEGNEQKNTVSFTNKEGKKITLDIDSDTKIASGYFPEKDDVVEIKYTKKGMLLKSIKLIDRPAPPEPEDQPEETADESAGDAEE